MKERQDQSKVVFGPDLEISLQVRNQEVRSSSHADSWLVGYNARQLDFALKVAGAVWIAGSFDLDDVVGMRDAAAPLVNGIIRLGYNSYGAWRVLITALWHHAPEEALSLLNLARPMGFQAISANMLGHHAAR